MPTTRLNPGSVMPIGLGSLLLDWTVVGAPAEEVRLEVLLRDGGSPLSAITSVAPGRLLVSSVLRPAEVVARPASGATFPDGVVVLSQLTRQLGGRDVAQYQLPPADVSGTPHTTLLMMTPGENVLELAVPADLTVFREDGATPSPSASTGTETPARRPLLDGVPPAEPPVTAEPGGSLQQRAAYAARRSGGHNRLPDHRRRELVLAVDASASFLPVVRSGATQALLEVLLGVNQVVGVTDEIPVWRLGGVPECLPTALGVATLEGYWQRALGDRSETGGTPLAPLVAEVSGDGRRTVVVITDGAPPDVLDLGRRLVDAGGGTRWHLLAVARSMPDPQVRRERWRDELDQLRPLVERRLLTASAVTPGEGAGWLESRLQDREELSTLVTGLPFWKEAS